MRSFVAVGSFLVDGNDHVFARTKFLLTNKQLCLLSCKQCRILWAPGSGEAISELIVKGKSSYNLSSFRIERFGMDKPKRGGRGRKKNNEGVGEQW